MSDEWIPWTRTGPDRSYLWDWENPELRSSVVVGTILETYDCGYLTVDQITDQGIITPDLDGSRLWNWHTLKKLECIIYEQPDAGEQPG